MIDASNNIDLVTMRRLGDLRRSQESYHSAVTEGRLFVRPRQGGATDGGRALVAADHGGAGGLVTKSASLPEAATSTTIPTETRPPDPETAWRHTRLAITAGLVVLLLVVWIWQKRAGR